MFRPPVDRVFFCFKQKFIKSYTRSRSSSISSFAAAFWCCRGLMIRQISVVSLQNGIKNIDEVSSVKVSVDFGDVKTKTVRLSNFTVENSADGQKIEVLDSYVDVTFRGIASDIAKIDSADLRLVIDCQNKIQSKGVNSMAVYAVIPDSYKVGVLGKYYVMVNVS